MSVEIINYLKRILKGISTVQGVLFSHHTRHQKGGGDDLESLLKLANLAEKSHASLTGITASQHHVKTGDDEVYGNIRAGLDAGKPAAGIVGRIYLATDTGYFYRDDGTSWVKIPVKHAVYM